MTSPVVSFVIPVWDRHVELLSRCLQAINRETLSAPVIIVDNASCVPVASTHRGRVVRLPNRQTVGAARNAGLAQVVTPFVVFADADDELFRGSLQRATALLTSNPDSCGVVGRRLVEECGHHRLGTTPSRLFLRTSRHAPRLAALLWLAAFQAYITNTLLRTSHVREAGGFPDDNFAEDWHLAARLARRGQLLAIDDPVSIYHRHPAAIRNSIRPTDHAAARQRICDDCRHDLAATALERCAAATIQQRGQSRILRWAHPTH